MPKSAVRPINNSKNKLNSEIILIFNSNPNTHFESERRKTMPNHEYTSRILEN